MKIFSKKYGFTLMELMVSVSITAVLMLGVSVFFSGTLKNMFMAREQVTNTQSQFVVNTILDGKFANSESLDTNNYCSGDCVVLRNDMNTGDLPFTYIGTRLLNVGTPEESIHVVFKDFFVFNGQDEWFKSYDETSLKNPAGTVALGADTFIAVPLEDKIYKCMDTPESCSGPLDMSNLDLPLDHPMDIAYDGTDTIYITDAGNNRIVKVTNPEDSPTAEEFDTNTTFNYPTGIEFYEHDGNKYLFVADTYNHVVKKIKISDGDTEVVVGDGDDEVCDFDGRDHSAIYCKLNFPTGLMIYDNGDGEELYIADTGNSRVLKVSDPNPDLSNHEFTLDLDGSTQIGHIDFVFPGGTTIGSISEGVGDNSLHLGKYSSSSTTVSLSLTAQMDTPYIPCVGLPVCTNYFRGFEVSGDNAIFHVNDKLKILDVDHTVDSITTKVNTLPPNSTISPIYGENVSIVQQFSGTHDFFLNLNDVSMPSGFNTVKVEAYDEGDVLNNDPPNTSIIRIGDGELGTFEDTIVVVPENNPGDHEYPTGLGWNGTLQVSGSPDYATEFPNYDYTSDFEVDGFEFDEPNTDEILELNFDAMLGVDDEGDPIWDNFTLNAEI